MPSPYGLTRFIENVGVSPDVVIDFTMRENLVTKSKSYVDAWIEEVKKLLQ